MTRKTRKIEVDLDIPRKDALDIMSESQDRAALLSVVSSMEIWTESKKDALKAMSGVDGLRCFECIELLEPLPPKFGCFTGHDELGVRQARWSRAAAGGTWYCVALQPPSHPRWKVVREVGQ